jgi:hypothetical protein
VVASESKAIWSHLVWFNPLGSYPKHDTLAAPELSMQPGPASTVENTGRSTSNIFAKGL